MRSTSSIRKNTRPTSTIGYTGGVQDTIEEQAALIADLELSTVVVVILVTLAMIVFYRNLRATIALVLSTFCGTLWTFGISYFVVGYLNANSAFLGSIVIGNGINFGIIYLARYLEERRRGRGSLRATRLAVIHTATATWTAALAAGLAYGSLILTGFRGFRQFGVIGLIGMVLCWISAFTLLPAYLTIFERIRPLVPKSTQARRPRFASLAAWLVSRHAVLVCLLAAAGTAASAVAIVSAARDPHRQILETDLRNLRNKESVRHGSLFLSKYLDEIFQRYLSPLVILPKTREEARKIEDILKTERDKQGPASLMSTIQTLDDFLPEGQRKKLEVLQEIRKLLPPRLLARLSHDDQERVTTLLRAERLKPVEEQQLPELLLKKFTERDGAVGNLVLVEPPLDSRVTGDGRTITQLIHELRQAADSVTPGTPVAGALPIIADMFEAISTRRPARHRVRAARGGHARHLSLPRPRDDRAMSPGAFPGRHLACGIDPGLPAQDQLPELHRSAHHFRHRRGLWRERLPTLPRGRRRTDRQGDSRVRGSRNTL